MMIDTERLIIKSEYILAEDATDGTKLAMMTLLLTQTIIKIQTEEYDKITTSRSGT